MTRKDRRISKMLRECKDKWREFTLQAPKRWDKSEIDYYEVHKGGKRRSRP